MGQQRYNNYRGNQRRNFNPQYRNSPRFRPDFRNRGSTVEPLQGKEYCRLCPLSNKPRHIFTSHSIISTDCPSLSGKDKAKLTALLPQQLNALSIDNDDDIDEQLAQEAGYGPNDQDDDQVIIKF